MKLPKNIEVCIFSCVLLVSCTTIYTKSPDGGVAIYNALGADSQGVTITPQGSQIAENKNSEAFNRAATIAGSAFAASQMASVAKNFNNQNGLTDRAGIEAGTSQSSIEAGTQQIISGNQTTVELEKIKSETQIKLQGSPQPQPETPNEP
jgi:hypothetical protein